MRKLLLQSAIATLVAINIASSVMADQAKINVTLQGTQTASSNVAQTQQSYDISLPLIPEIKNQTDFSNAIKKTTLSINTIYHTTRPTVTSMGCIQIKDLDTTINGGGLLSVVLDKNMTYGNNTKISTDKISFGIINGGNCTTSQTIQPMGRVPATGASDLQTKLQTVGVGNNATKAPKSTVAIWYQIPHDILDQVKISDINTPSYTKGGNFSGELTFTLTPAAPAAPPTPTNN